MIIIASSIIVLCIVGYGIYAEQQSSWPFGRSPSGTLTNDKYGKINYSPPTEQEVKDSQNAKKNNTPQDQEVKSNDTTPVSSKKSVSVMINAEIVDNNLQIRASTPQIIEGSGTCTASVTNGTETLPDKTSPAFIDATSSICEPMYIPVSQLSKGNWYVTVTYSSPDAQGVSEKEMVSVK